MFAAKKEPKEVELLTSEQPGWHQPECINRLKKVSDIDDNVL